MRTKELIQNQKLYIQEIEEQLNELTKLLDVKNKLSAKERIQLENSINLLEQEKSLRLGFCNDLETLL